MRPGQRGCSLDGDADRLMYYYLDDRGQFHMLDGDKIAALVAAFIVDLVKTAGLEEEVRVGIVQTAYANGGSTKYLSEVNLCRSILISWSLVLTVDMIASSSTLRTHRGQALASRSRTLRRRCLL